MKYIQIFLSVQAGKWMIAEALARMDCVQDAFARGELAVKAGTTTSCLSWLLTDRCGSYPASGTAESLVECRPGAQGCREHLSCGYRGRLLKNERR